MRSKNRNERRRPWAFEARRHKNGGPGYIFPENRPDPGAYMIKHRRSALGPYLVDIVPHNGGLWVFGRSSTAPSGGYRMLLEAGWRFWASRPR